MGILRRSGAHSIALVACLLAGHGVAQARIECMNRGGDALPADAFPVPVARVAELQQLLDAHGHIRLDPAGDYRRAARITLASGQAIFGVAGTRVGRIVVVPGTSGAIISGVVPDALEFPPSRERTHDNCFERFAARVTAQEALRLRNVVVENNLFLDLGRVVIDTTTGGSVRNNRFIRTQAHGYSPSLQLRGRGPAQGDRNVFLWTNVLSAPGAAIEVQGEQQANFVGLDAEDWNHGGDVHRTTMFNAAGTGTLRVWMAQGGQPKPADPYMDIAAERFELAGLRLYGSGEPAIRLRAGTKHFVSVLASEKRLQDDAPDSAGWMAYPDWTERVAQRGAGESPGDSSAGTPWEAPQFGAIPDPAGADWQRQRAQGVDSTAELQHLIDTQGIAVLPAGVFYISAPLRLRSGQGLVGAGAGRTAIVAKSGDIDLIVGDDHLVTPRPLSLVLVDLTLQGGRAGIRHDGHGSGAGQYVYTQLSHVVFRDMSEAGIVLDAIYGWDNNLLDELTFFRVPVGIKQKPNPAYISAAISGNAPDANYMDKNVCYRCRFEDVDTGLQLIARRADNLNACVNCRFVRNRHGAIRLQYNGSTVIANSDFIECGGDPVIDSDQPVGVVSSRFSAGASGSLLGRDVMCESCVFDAGKSGSSATIAAANSRLVLMNSRAANVALGAAVSGIVANSNIPGVAPARMLQLTKGRQSVLLAGVPQPAVGLLVDWSDQ